MIYCEICDKEISIDGVNDDDLDDNIIKFMLEIHQEQCKIKQINLINNFYKNKEEELTESQKNAINYFKKKSKIIAKNMKLLTLAKFYEYGYDENDMNYAVKYLQENVQIIIHFDLNKIIDHFINDNYYRNKFEVVINDGDGSYCKSRIIWEKNLFSNNYDKAKNFERVKYGCINVFNNKNGVSVAKMYGDSYLILKNKIKSRTSFVIGDSSTMQFQICSFDDPIHFFHYIDNKMFIEYMEMIIKKRNNNEVIHVQRYKYDIYIEVQIHGLINLSKDIEKIMINKKHKKDGLYDKVIEKYCNKNNIDYDIIDN